MFDPSKRIVIESYTGLHDDELEELCQLVQKQVDLLDFPDRIKKTLTVKIENDSYFEDEEPNELY